MKEDLYKKADLLFDKFKDYIVLDFSRTNGRNYYLSKDAPQEAIDAEREYMSFAPDLEPIR
ncbi:hypothetical protein CYJ27_02345 [Aerococcus christensenii]|uniref:Uncharacterized protein n=1 Tax=Aerococcus christensenii TaxID=87541 RepID=A0A2I1K7C1_9LACT|nr:hypothetical protein [Aerococcus christensenii]PKY91536.1 hypothetical protein CYJ27_02345 [Aerococcus christensenii]